jgi:hypothetical protein
MAKQESTQNNSGEYIRDMHQLYRLPPRSGSRVLHPRAARLRLLREQIVYSFPSINHLANPDAAAPIRLFYFQIG